MARGVLVQRPYWDARLVQLSLSLPQALHVQPGTMKPVLHAALRRVLPPMLLARRRKTHLGILNRGFVRHREQLRSLIEETQLPTMLRRAALLDAVDKAALGLYAEAPSVGRLRLALSFLLWWSQRSAWLTQPFPVAYTQPFSAPSVSACELHSRIRAR